MWGILLFSAVIKHCQSASKSHGVLLRHKGMQLFSSETRVIVGKTKVGKVGHCVSSSIILIQRSFYILRASMGGLL